LVLTSVVGIQALLFQDGGLLAMGANIFNMGIVGVAVSYTAYRTFRKFAGNRPSAIFAGGFASAWLSIIVAALGVALQLAVSGTTSADLAIPAMGGIHALIGIGEGLITAGALAFIYSTRRSLLTSASAQPAGGRMVWLAGLVIALALAVLSPLASSNPDGLEWVAEQNGFLQRAQAPSYQFIPDYVMPGISNEHIATVLAGVVGTLIVFGVAAAVAYSRRNRQSASG
jgi:cobalt/nickel transport system permease protein